MRNDPEEGAVESWREPFRAVYWQADLSADVPGTVAIQPELEPGKDSDRDIDFESIEFNEKYAVTAATPDLAYRVITPTTLALLIDTFDFPGKAIELGGVHPRFSYYVFDRGVRVSCSAAPNDPCWTAKDVFVVLDAQFLRFYSSLSNVVRK
jgi:hypothetical protein